jgi:hypothetical protein
MAADPGAAPSDQGAAPSDQGAAASDPGQGAAQQQGGPGQKAPSAEAPVKEAEGKITYLDPQAHTMRIGGFAGLFGTNLEVTDQTKFMAPGGKQVDFNSLKEGDRVRASYQRVGDRNIANQISIIPPGEKAQPQPGAQKPEGGAGAGGESAKQSPYEAAPPQQDSSGSSNK